MEPRLTFGEALEALKRGKKVKRSGWQGYWILVNDQNETIIKAYCDNAKYPETNGKFVAAMPYQVDMLAEDWVLVN